MSSEPEHAASNGGPPVAPPKGGSGVVRIASLREGAPVDGRMACGRKAVMNSTRTGRPFLAVVLKDGRDSIPGRSFEHVQSHAARFERGDVVHVRGKVICYRDELQIWIDEIARCEAGDDHVFVPVSRRDLDELDGFLEHLACEHVYQSGYRELLESLLSDERLRGAWRRAPCTHDGHHAYLGGLLEHTVAVATLAAEACEVHPRLDRDLVVSAALVHDLGHIRAFTYSGEIQPSDEGRLVGHVQLGLEIVRVHARRTGLPERSWQALANCVLTHHGPGALGQNAFRSPEAIVLYRLNTLDTEVKRAFEVRRRGDRR